MNVTMPRADIPFMLEMPDGSLRNNPEWIRLLTELLGRAGGTTGPGTEDLTVSQFEDAGIEETKAGLSTARDEFGQLPRIETTALDGDQLPPALQFVPTEDASGGVSALREELDALRVRVASLEQGTSA